jgi:hypothetical protein
MYTEQKEFLEIHTDSDKLHHHGYHRLYPWFFRHLKTRQINLLEIGLDETESLKLWKGYFKNADIYGIDIDPKEFDDPRVKLYQVDQSKAEELDEFVNSVGVQFDVIIDDGSHVPSHQILTLNKLWTLLKPGGTYFIEDVETSFWGKSKIYNYYFNSNSRKSNFVAYAKDFVNLINHEFLKRRPERLGVGAEVEMVSFSHNCVILVKKDQQTFSPFYSRPYRYSDKLNYRTILGWFARIKRILSRKISKK